MIKVKLYSVKIDVEQDYDFVSEEDFDNIADTCWESFMLKTFWGIPHKTEESFYVIPLSNCIGGIDGYSGNDSIRTILKECLKDEMLSQLDALEWQYDKEEFNAAYEQAITEMFTLYNFDK